jgi:hypothetical protein
MILTFPSENLQPQAIQPCLRQLNPTPSSSRGQSGSQQATSALVKLELAFYETQNRTSAASRHWEQRC